jgi:hypothetical protein
MTKAEVQALIDSNLASASAITALKHREVETALLNFADAQSAGRPLLTGTLIFGDIYSGHDNATISFTDLGTSDYIVLGSIYSKVSGTTNKDEIVFVIKNKTSTSFDVYFRELQSTAQDFNFDYIIFRK